MSRLYIRRLEGVGAGQLSNRLDVDSSVTPVPCWDCLLSQSLQFEYYSLEADAEGFWWVTLRAKVTWKI